MLGLPPVLFFMFAFFAIGILVYFLEPLSRFCCKKKDPVKIINSWEKYEVDDSSNSDRESVKVTKGAKHEVDDNSNSESYSESYYDDELSQSSGITTPKKVIYRNGYDGESEPKQNTLR